MAAPIRLNGFRWVLLAFTACLALRCLSPLVVQAGVGTGLLAAEFAVVAGAEGGEFVAYQIDPAKRPEVSATVERMRKGDFRNYTLRFTEEQRAPGKRRSAGGRASIAIWEDRSLSGSVHGKASPSEAGDPEIRLNANGNWDWWTVVHEGGHWMMLDPCIRGALWAWLPFLVDMIPNHGFRVGLRTFLGPGWDWIVLGLILIGVRMFIGREL